MSNTIGEVNINLRMSLTQFSKDVQSGTQEASRATKKFAQESKADMKDAREAMALFSEQTGIAVPRALRNILAEIPGVSTAMANLVPIAAVGAGIGVIAEVISKIAELREKALQSGQESAAAMLKFEDALQRLQERGAQLRNQAEALASGWAHVSTSQEDMRAETAALMPAFDSLVATQKKEIDYLGSIGHYAWIAVQQLSLMEGIDLTPQASGFEQMAEDLKAIAQTQGPAAALVATITDLSTAAKAYAANPTEANYATVKALQEQYAFFLQSTNNLLDAQALRVQQTAEEWKRYGEETQAALNKEIDTMRSLETKSADMTKGEQTRYDLEIQKVQMLVQEWQEYGNNWTKVHGGISEVVNANIEALDMYVKKLQTDAAQAIDLALKAKEGAEAAQVGKTVSGTVRPALFSGSPEAMAQYKLQTDANYRLQQAGQIYTQTRTAGEQYADTMQRLNMLLESGAIDQVTYQRAAQQAAQQTGQISAKFQELGMNIGESVLQAAAFGGSWADTFKGVGIQLAQLILQMLFLKSLQAESAGGGIGGFFANIAEGFGGMKAGGGPVDSSHFYVVGERGPELFAPGARGSIVPNSVMAGSGRDGDTHINQSITVNTPDANSFGKSQNQIMSQAYRDAAIAHSRNRGR